MTRKPFAVLMLVVAFIAVLLVAIMPVDYDSPEEVFEIPNGTWAQRMSGDAVNILPDKIHLSLGVRNILVLRNLDNVPQIFGPTLIMPGQSFKLPFDQVADYQFECTAHASGQMTVVVDPEPTLGWQRLRWRIKNLIRNIV